MNRKKHEQDESRLLELVENLIGIAERAELAELRVRDGELEVQLSRQPAAVPLQPQPQPQPMVPVETAAGTAAPEEGEFINAPMPSRFYRSPAPDEPPFVQIGDTVNTGDSLAVLEVMKTYNPVEAPFSCEILEILAEDGAAVEYGEPLFRVARLT